MNHSELRRALRAHYDAHALNSHTVAGLTAAARPRRSLFVWSGFAAVLLLGAGLFFFLPSEPALADTVAREVARGHRKDLAPDVRVTFPALCTAMDKLDFELCDPATIVDGARTDGGRYCSIQGHPAAQLKVVDDGGRRWTVYQCADGPAFDEIRDGEVRVVDGVTVRMRRESGLLICLAFTEP